MSLAVLANQMASKGRNGDSMLVHMSPSEVAGLHALAVAHGEKLTINPETGLPEAFSLKSLLPMIAGIALGPAGFGLMSAGMAGLAVGAVTGLATGSLKQGIMAGIGAYGGANLGAGLEAASMEAARDAATSSAAQAAFEAANPAVFEGATGTTADVMANASAAAKQAAAPSFFDKTLGGIQALGTDAGRAAFMQGVGDKSGLYKAGMMAATPVMADAMVPTATKMPTVKPGDTGYIRQKRFDPFSQTYEDITPVPASEWGSRTFAQNRGYQGGGIVALADGGDLTKAQLGAQAQPYAQGTPATAQDISNIYYSTLGRAPDEGGLQFYQASQWSPDQIRADSEVSRGTSVCRRAEDACPVGGAGRAVRAGRGGN